MSQIEEIVRKCGVQEGLILANANAIPITASVFINDDDSGWKDYQKWLERFAPLNVFPQTYAHNRTGEDNGDSHMKRQIIGREVGVAIPKEKLDFARGGKSFRRVRRPPGETGAGQDIGE